MASVAAAAAAAAAAVVALGITVVAAAVAVVSRRRGRVKPRLCQQSQGLRLQLPVPVRVEASAALQTQAAEQRVARHEQVAQEVRQSVWILESLRVCRRRYWRTRLWVASAASSDIIPIGRWQDSTTAAEWLSSLCSVVDMGWWLYLSTYSSAVRRQYAGESVDVQSVQTADSLQHRADPVDQLLVDAGAGRELGRRAEGAAGGVAVVGVATASRPRLVHAQPHPGPEGLLHLSLALLAALFAVFLQRESVAEVQEAVEASAASSGACSARTVGW